VGNQYNDTIWQKVNLLPCTVSTSEILETKNSVYPNPSSSIINLNFEEKIVDYAIFDANGKKYDLILENNKLYIEDLSKGIYFLKIQFENSIEYLKFNKN
jgi:hypothetical protein